MTSRKNAVFGLAFGLTLVMVASAAYACTTWVGQFTVTRDADGDGSTTYPNEPYEYVRTYGMGKEANTGVVDIDGATGMLHCWMEGALRVDVDSAAPSPSTVKLDFRGIVMTPTTCTAANPRPPKDGTYTVSYLNTGFGDFVGGNLFGWTGTVLNPEWFTDRQLQRQMVRDCMAIGGAASRWLDTEELIVTGGVGTKTVTIDPKPGGSTSGIPDAPGTESAICVQQKGGTYTGAPDGAQNPIIVM